uniref:Uncharacterized protein n=1 Tax=Tanacetum cinerariifolium TaxID=118510 RepID=A0A6L2MS45_TANCI|nr:hypothetical protein [Tanacetum cinerariifolium]
MTPMAKVIISISFVEMLREEECCEAAIRKYKKHAISVVKLRKTPNSDNMRHVKENQEKDKIESKPEKREAWPSREKSKAITVERERKTKELNG